MTECQDTYGVMIKRTLNFKQYQNDPTLSGVYPVHVFSPPLSPSPVFALIWLQLQALLLL